MNLKLQLRGGVSGARFEGKAFKSQDLRRIFLHQCNLRETVWDGADLRGADFSGSDLYKASFRGAVLDHASFRGAGLYGAVFTNASTKDCDVFGAGLEKTVALRLPLLRNLGDAIFPGKIKLAVGANALSGAGRLFGTEAAAVYLQGTCYLILGHAVMPLTSFKSLDNSSLNALSQKCLEGSAFWSPDKRRGWAGTSQAIWALIRDEIFTAAEDAEKTLRTVSAPVCRGNSGLLGDEELERVRKIAEISEDIAAEAKKQGLPFVAVRSFLRASKMVREAERTAKAAEEAPVTPEVSAAARAAERKILEALRVGDEAGAIGLIRECKEIWRIHRRLDEARKAAETVRTSCVQPLPIDGGYFPAVYNNYAKDLWLRDFRNS